MSMGYSNAISYIHFVDCKGQSLVGSRRVVRGPPFSCGFVLSVKDIYEWDWRLGLVKVFIALTTFFSSSIVVLL